MGGVLGGKQMVERRLGVWVRIVREVPIVIVSERMERVRLWKAVKGLRMRGGRGGRGRRRRRVRER